MFHKHVKILFVILLFIATEALSQSQGVAFERITNLDGTGFTREQLDSLTDYIRNNLTTTAMIILKDGKILYEYGDVSKVSYIASCRKSVLAILYGKYVENGTIDLDETIGEMGIDEDRGLLDIEKQATVRDIITSRSGVFYEAANQGYDKEHILKRGSVKPGEYFVYNNWDFNVAGYIFELKTGHNIYEELQNQLAIPLGFQDWDIKKQHKKYNRRKSRYPAYHMYLSTRDMAKIGQLMLNKGKWRGQQIVPASWIEKITTPVTPVDTVNKRYGRDSLSPYQFSYGYMWWIIEYFRGNPDYEGAYTATGYGGQFITVIPKLNIVIAHKTKLGLLNYLGLKPDVSDRQYWDMLWRFVR